MAKVLVIEDEESILMALEDDLTLEGYEVAHDRDGEVDKVLGLELGADDYVTKPFSARELIARVSSNCGYAYR